MEGEAQDLSTKVKNPTLSEIVRPKTIGNIVYVSEGS